MRDSAAAGSAPGRGIALAETRRQAVHIAMGGFAFALAWMTWWQAAACALAALLFNAFALPRLARVLFRDAELHGRRPGGIVFYPLAVLLLILAFPDRLDIVALAWGVLAAGDGFATIVGRAVRGPRLPWNRDKTWAGTAAFVLAGTAAGTVLAWWARDAVVAQPPVWFTWTAPVLAAVIAALVETLPVRLDDNLSIPAAAAATAWVVTKISPEAALASWPLVEGRLVAAVFVNGVAAAAGYFAGTVTVSGMLAGFAIGVAVWLGTGATGWALLFCTFLVASLSSRLGLQRKIVLGIAEARGGRRGPGNAIANCGVAAVAALLVAAGEAPSASLLLFVTALVAGASDTVSSEIGKAFGGTTVLITTLRRVPPGTSGALSAEGTIAGVASAFVLALLAAGLGLVPPGSLWIVVVAATAGSVVESGLGATLEGPGVLDNDLLNFLNTAAAAGVAAVLARSLA
jgi:uncharacterized protein (TIGR00297 family)